MTEYSYTNLQIKSSDADKVRQAIEVCDIGSAKMLARAGVEWVSVYPFLTEGDFFYLKETAWKLSAYLNLPVFALMVPDEAVLKYALFRGKIMLDMYCSRQEAAVAEDSPDTEEPQGKPGNGNGHEFKNCSAAELSYLHSRKGASPGGNVDVLLPLCVQGTSKKKLEKLLHSSASSDDPSAGERLAGQLAQVLGIPRVQICTGYNYLKWAQAGR